MITIKLSRDEKRLYWREWQDVREVLQNASGEINTILKKIGKMDSRSTEIQEELKHIERRLIRLSRPRLLKETPKQNAREIANCPWKKDEYIRCISCEYRKSGRLFEAYDPHDHETISKLRPAEETASGR